MLVVKNYNKGCGRAYLTVLRDSIYQPVWAREKRRTLLVMTTVCLMWLLWSMLWKCKHGKAFERTTSTYLLTLLMSGVCLAYINIFWLSYVFYLFFFPFNMWFISILQRGGMVTETLYVKWWILGVWLSLSSSRHSYTSQSIWPVILSYRCFFVMWRGIYSFFCSQP